MYSYGLCGMRVESEFPVPELRPWSGPPDQDTDLRFAYGQVPERLEGADHAGKVFQTRGNEYLLTVPGSARFLVRNGAEILMQPAPGSDEVDARALLSGPVQGVLYHQRGLFPLHASTVVQNGQAIAIAGPSGSGKSTLAAALGDAGLPVIGDDICVVEPGPPGVPRVLPAYSRVRLWRDSVDALGYDATSLPRALSGKEKFLVDRQSAALDAPVRLGHVLILTREHSCRKPKLERLTSAAAMQAITLNIHVRRPAGALGLQRRLFSGAARLASHVGVWRFLCPDNLSQLEEVAAKLRELEEIR